MSDFIQDCYEWGDSHYSIVPPGDGESFIVLSDPKEPHSTKYRDFHFAITEDEAHSLGQKLTEIALSP
ncbi:MAG: hypothetical protein F6K65_22295, partial [Moorea sp. SIO3C2]|nr:hypothetical protein [Moorena sp. SIO3C2]